MAGTAALLFTDIVDSTLTTQRLGDERAVTLWTEHDRRARRLLREHRGREIGRSDGLLLLFDSGTDAARYALDYHAQMAAIGLTARAGLHVGPVLLRQSSDEDVALGAKRIEVEGLALPLAARVMAMAQGGQTLLTATARQGLDAAALGGGVQLRSHGHYRLKGIDVPVAIFEIGVAPGCSFCPPPDTDKSYRVINAGDVWQPARNVPHRVPAEPDAFVGRGDDLAAIVRAFDAGTRVLTLLGPGGTGKTRLAIRYARGWLGDWPGGAWFCDLSDASSLDGIQYAAAGTLGVRLGSGDATAQIGEALASRGRCLLVLDNFEQVAEHAPATLGRWLELPDATFLVTSRERLDLPGEVVQQVEPLPLDGPATELFMARARAVRHDFAPDAAQRDIIAQIVTLLDGLPLAIELAAARIAVLSPAQLLVRLRDRFGLLTGRRGTPRQATLRAAIDWSWHLLNAWEQAALEQCSVFEAGFTLAAAEGVIDLSAWPAAPPVIDVMHALVDKSLLRRWMPEGGAERHEVDEPWFGMYISIHEYVSDRCRERGAEYVRALQVRHGRHFATFGTDAALEALFTHGGLQRLHALRRELDNLVGACRHAVERQEGETAVACFRAAWEVLALRGPFGVALALGEAVLAIDGLDVRLAELARLSHSEALSRAGSSEGLEARLTEALARVRGMGEHKLEARIRGRLGNMYLWSGRLEDAYACYVAALECAHAAASRLLEARMHGNVAIACHERGRADEAMAHYEAALAIEREIGSERDEAITLCNYADLLGAQGYLERARDTFAAALALLRKLGDRDTEAITLQQLGEFELGQGLAVEALASLQAALALTLEIGNHRVLANVRRSLGEALLELCRHDEARVALEDALAMARAIPNRRLEANAVAVLGDLAVREGRPAEGAALLAEAEATLREIDDPPLLASVLCTRGLVDLARSNRASAQAALAEARRIAATIHAGPGSGLSRQVERLREAIGA